MSTQPLVCGSGRGLCLLSIDGGGIRGLSTLLIVREILFRVQQIRKLDQIPRACEIFDLAGGTGSGGIIVIMLFRLRMPIDDAIEAYVHLSEYVFSKRKRWPRRNGILFDASRLEGALVSIIQGLGIGVQARELRMLDESRTKCFVCTTSQRNMSSPILFRSWTPSVNPTYNPTVVEACRATTADMPIFASIKIGKPPLKETFVGGSIRCNNPVKFVLEESKSAFPNETISCIVSIGAGLKDVVGLAKPNSATARLFDVFKEIATDCEPTSEDTEKQFTDNEGAYFRLNVDRGLQGVGLTQWEKLSAVKAHTLQYLKVNNIDQKVAQLVQTLTRHSASPPITLSSDEWQAFDNLRKSAVNAYYDSEKQPSSSECLPGTRSRQINMLMDWVEANKKERPLFVVLGPAGSGKSSLLRTVARMCEEKKYLAANFFFSGTDSTRNTLRCLINTIVYQIAEAIPELRPYVARSVHAEPSMLSRSFEYQTQWLLLNPLSQLRSEYSDFSYHHRVIIIDAMDECLEVKEQLRFIYALSTVLKDKSFPFLCLLSTRFDRHIERNLTTILNPWIYGRMTLGGNEDDERGDIWTYLQANIGFIRKSHPFGTRIPDEWPLKSDLKAIVQKSGGQFIYASTVIRYVESPNHNPYEQLRYILGISTIKSGAGPFAELDALYRALMSSVENIETAIEILGIELVCTSSQFWTPRTLRLGFNFNKHLLSPDADIFLAPLASVLSCEHGKIKFYHLSFAEFLLDHTRSRKYVVHLKAWQRWIVSKLVLIFYDHGCILPDDVEHLIKEATPGNNLHQAINEGFAHVQVANHSTGLPSGGNFNLWPFVASEFFRQLHFKISAHKISDAINQQGEDFLPFPILVKLGSKNNLSNTFFLFELCRICGGLQKLGFLEPDLLYTSVTLFPLLMTYLANYFDDEHCLGQWVLMPDDYLSALFRCLWYLQTSNCDIRSSLKGQFRSLQYLLPTFGIPNFLEDISSNLTRGALDILPILLHQATPSDNLLAALKRPFDNEVVSRTPSSFCGAMGIIHDYLMKHDREYQLEQHDHTTRKVQCNPGGDEPLPKFQVFLHRSGSWVPPWIMN